MSIPVLMPALSPTMTEGKLAKWHVKVGDQVKAGQVICEIETDKATMEVEAVDEGTVAQIVVPEGTEGVAVNAPIMVLAAEGENVADVAKAAPPPTKPPASQPMAAKADTTSTQGQPKAELPIKPAAPPAAAAPPEHEWKGKTVHMTVREALRDAMAEEMRKDE